MPGWPPGRRHRRSRAGPSPRAGIPRRPRRPAAPARRALARPSPSLRSSTMLRLPGVDLVEETGVVAHRVTARRFDLQHVGAQGSQQRRGVGPGAPDAQVEDLVPARNVDARCIGRRVLHSGQRLPSSGARLLLLHRDHRSRSAHEAYNLWHRLRPPARAIHHRRHQLRPTLGPLAPLPGAGGGVTAAPRAVPLHDALPPAGRVRDPPVLRPGQGPARRGPLLPAAQSPPFRALSRSRVAGPHRGCWSRPRRCPSALPPGSTPWWVRPLEAPRLVGHDGVAGAWQFARRARHITVPFVDGDLWRVAGALGSVCREHADGVEWAGPLEPVDANGWDWFATLSGR